MMRIGVKKRTFLLIVAAICVVTTIIVSSQSYSDGRSSASKKRERPTSINDLITNDMSSLDQTKKFDKSIETFMRRWEMTGASFALMKDDKLIYAKGYGYANKEREERCEVGHVFRIASVSKLITATAVMKLAEEGRLTLSSQVFGENGILCDTMFLDLYSRSHTKITVEHLLRHTSGLVSPLGDPAFANYTVSNFLKRPLPLSVDDMVLYATKLRVKYRPGERYDYSNLGYILLGKIIEVVSGMDYESYVQESILYPIGCYDMFIGQNFSRNHASNEVRYYEVKEAEPVEAYDGSGVVTMKSDGGNNVTLLGSAGGWVSSSVELLKFVSAIDDCPLRESILSRESIAQMVSGKRTIGWASTSKGQWLRSGSMAGTSALIKRQSNGYTWVFIVNNSAWIGPKITGYISSHITSAISNVEGWPERDLFDIEKEKN